MTGTCKATEIRIGSFDGTTLQFSGINVQIVSGAGSTGAPVNGKGNLIVGHDAITTSPTQTGSHNVIIGDEHTFTSYGGLVGGSHNSITGASASVSGGVNNVASGDGSSISGGAALTQPVADGWAAGSVTPGNTINGDFESP